MADWNLSHICELWRGGMVEGFYARESLPASGHLLLQKRKSLPFQKENREMATWNIDTAHSAIHFSVRHMVVSKTRGRFTKWSGQIEFDPEQPRKSTVQVSIDPASVDTADAQRDAHLRSPDFFDVEKFPQASFRSAQIEDLGGDRYRVHGDLTVHGVTRPVVLDAVFEGSARDPWGGERAGFSASTSIDRRDFGLGWNKLLETGGVLVGDKVELQLEVESVKQAAVKAA
jgi:polyisoprenoid-binding protein YceI